MRHRSLPSIGFQDTDELVCVLMHSELIPFMAISGMDRASADGMSSSTQFVDGRFSYGTGCQVTADADHLGVTRVSHGGVQCKQKSGESRHDVLWQEVLIDVKAICTSMWTPNTPANIIHAHDGVRRLAQRSPWIRTSDPIVIV